jgi:hypothetical protein
MTDPVQLAIAAGLPLLGSAVAFGAMRAELARLKADVAAARSEIAAASVALAVLTARAEEREKSRLEKLSGNGNGSTKP